MESLKKILPFIFVAIVFALGGYFVSSGILNNQKASIYDSMNPASTPNNGTSISTITTLSASNISSNSVQMNGKINLSQGLMMKRYFVFGKTDIPQGKINVGKINFAVPGSKLNVGSDMQQIPYDKSFIIIPKNQDGNSFYLGKSGLMANTSYYYKACFTAWSLKKGLQDLCGATMFFTTIQ